MGRGNFCPSGELTDQWYIDIDDLYNVDDEEISEDNKLELLEEDIHYVMAEISRKFPSFRDVIKCVDNYWGETVLLENKLFQIGVADNQWSTAIWIAENPELYDCELNLAGRHFETYRNAIRKELLDFFGVIYLRNGAWMSTKWTEENERKVG